jgi:Cytochrome P460
MKLLTGWPRRLRGRDGVIVGFALIMLVGSVVYVAPASGQAGGEASPKYGITLPAGYRDWTLISVARVGAPLNDMRAKLGNDVAIKAYRAGTLPFPDGTIIARLAWNQTTSEEDNQAISPVLEKQFGPEAAKKVLSESFVAGSATNVQFMVKDSKKYASTGGWGFAQFDNGKPAAEAVHKTCFACHAPAKDRDFVFTRYSR